MPSLDDLKKRIKSVKSTQKITKAMKMVAAAKLKKAQESAERGRPYSEKMQNIILNLTKTVSDSENASTACLLVQYALMKGEPILPPKILLIFIILPGGPFSCLLVPSNGRKLFVHKNVPKTLVLIWARKSDVGICSTGPSVAIPALFTRAQSFFPERYCSTLFFALVT